MHEQAGGQTAVALTAALWLMTQSLGAQSAALRNAPPVDSLRRPPVPLESSVLLLNRRDFQQAARRVRKAVGYGCRRVNVVVTLHCEVNEDDTLRSLGMGHVRRFGPTDYATLTEELVHELEGGLRQGFAEAVRQQVDLVILPHLDSNGVRDRWRNYFRFDPTQPIGEFSYEQAMLQMVLAALDVTSSTKTQVDFNLTGEMGTTIFRHAERYRQVLRRLRARRGDVRFGFNLNHSGIEGLHPPSQRDCQAVQALIDDCDFIGFSNYRPVSVPPRKEDFRDSVVFFLGELQRCNLTLSPDMPLRFSEVGLGGAAAEGDSADIRAVAATPYAGPRYGDASPWNHRAQRDLRRQYHAALLEFLSHPTGPQPVTAAFLWSHSSWDPINPQSAANFDESIAASVRRHNQKVYQHRSRAQPDE